MSSKQSIDFTRADAQAFALDVLLFLLNIPRRLLQLLSTTFSFTLSFSTIFIGLIFLIFLTGGIIRYKVLTSYTKTKDAPLTIKHKDQFLENLLQDKQKEKSKSYLDEFLVAIKIFGYLEKPVFNELVKAMKTRKLHKGEILTIDDTLGFAIVVEGNVQMYHKINHHNHDDDTEIPELENETLNFHNEIYQLLNEVKSGNPLSSLINILSLFTDDYIKTRLNSPAFNQFFPDDPTPLNLDPSQEQSFNLIAKATSHSTIAIIPADSFRKLRINHPRSSSHIVQMVLTKLYRVTFQTAHNYLGLTREIFQTELNLNKNHQLKLPSYLIDVALNHFNDVSDERGRSMEKESSDHHSVKSPTTTFNKRPIAKRTESRHVVLDSKDFPSNPGDLLSNVPLSRTDKDDIDSDFLDRSFSAHEETALTSLKIALIEGMFQFLGLNRDSLIPVEERRDHNEYSGVYSGTHEYDDLEFENAKVEFANNIELQKFHKGDSLVEQNSQTKGFYFIVKGTVEITYLDPTTNKESLIHTVTNGGIAGFLGGLVSSLKSMVTIKSKDECFVAFLSNKKLEILCEKYFMIHLIIAKALIKSLSFKLIKLDSALEWINLESGETLFKQDTVANGIYIILNGRLRSIDENSMEILNEFGQGESFGEVEVLTAAKRSSTFIAIRDSEMARIPRTLFEILALENPSMMIKVSRIIAKTISKSKEKIINYTDLEVPRNNRSNRDYNLNKNYRTITILPTTFGLPVQEFAWKLIQSFQKVNKSVIGLDQASTLTHLGRYAFDKLSRLRQSGFFSDLEDSFELVVYVADTSINSSWTTTCIQQGDVILLLADAQSDDQSIGEFERLLLKTRTTARCELVLLHSEKFVEPGLVNKWLSNRGWIDSHHHIQFNSKVDIPIAKSSIPLIQTKFNNFANNLKTKVDNFRSKYIKFDRDYITLSSSTALYKDDFMRLARLLSGQAVGVVLGGGGARGFSHLGVLKALEENGIPIDMIGGTSIGSFVGGLYARDNDLVPIYGRTKKFAGRIGSIWRTLFDLTIPTTSYTTGHEFNRGIWKVFGDSRIEDFWLQYFCNSTNITNSCMEIHSTGYAWRFIRASMTLAGLLPPMTDHGSMLLDGGYVDNLPVDEMMKRGASVIIAVDVGSIDDRTPMTYGDSLSGFWNLFNRWNPFSVEPNVPTMSEIQMRLCYVSSVNALERAKVTPGIIYLRPPIDDYATLDFAKFEEIYHIGTVYGHQVLKELISNKQFPKIAGIDVIKEENRTRVIQRRNSI